MTEELKQKAKDFIDRINKESGGNWLDKYYLTDLLVVFATEETKELEAQIEKMKLCQNCKFEDNDYLAKPCCDCTRCFEDIKRNGNSDKWEIKE